MKVRPRMNLLPNEVICILYFQGFRYAGLQNSNQCFCSMSFGYYGPAAEEECHKKCKGNSYTKKEEICGAYYHNSVYRLGIHRNRALERGGQCRVSRSNILQCRMST